MTYDTLEYSFATGLSTAALYRLNLDTFWRHTFGYKVCYVQWYSGEVAAAFCDSHSDVHGYGECLIHLYLIKSVLIKE